MLKTLLSFVLLVIAGFVAAQDLSAYEKKTYTHSDGSTLPYRILYPKGYDKSKSYPLLLVLHGAGERGNDNEKQLTHGAALFLSEENRKNFNGFIIFPQCPTEGYWGSVLVDRTKSPYVFDFDYSRPATPSLKSAIGIVNKTVAEEGVDKSRLYIAGLSMGGMGTFEAVYRYPEMFVAATAICGAADTVRYDKRTVNTTFRLYHGDEDGVVPVIHSRAMVEKLMGLSHKVTYKEYAGVNHNSWDNAFIEPDFLTWFINQKKKKTK